MREAFASDLLSVARNIVTWIDDNDGDGGRKAMFAPLFDTKPNNGALGYHIGLKALDLTWLHRPCLCPRHTHRFPPSSTVGCCFSKA